jgi:hypothetical protein
MVPLPDGTVLVVNGAHHGLAGFASATDPNLNAILYDPTRPVNTRFSILGSTTIPRMYHSEATLLPDGRVLISGSDPQDQNFPEEYRVEVRLSNVSYRGRNNSLLSGLYPPLPDSRSKATVLRDSDKRLGL